MCLTRILPIAMLLVAVSVSCGGGSEQTSSAPVPGGGNNQSANISATVTPDEPNPSAKDVSMAQQPGGAGSTFALNVLVTQTNDIFGASFDVLYDPTQVNFLDWSEGNALESGGGLITYQVGSAQRGRLIVGISRSGAASGVDISSTSTLVQLVFEVTQAGSSAVSFDNAALHDSQLNLIPGLSWHGATVVAN